MAEVKLINVSKIYEGDKYAVLDVNLDINEKEFVVLVGPSGCGKSTTLRMIAGLENISSGEIYIDGRLVNDIPPKDRDIAMVFQNYALYPHMTVYDNMAFGLKLRKFSKGEIKKRVFETAGILGLEDLLQRKPKSLSGGQRQRVAVGRAIVRQPKVFLFDEPLSNLDAKLRVQMRTEISRLHKSLGATMIYVTHDQTEAMTMGDKIVVMKDGIVQQIDSPLNLYRSPCNKFAASFIGSPSMNFLKGIIIEQNDLRFISENNLISICLDTNKFVKLRDYAGRNVLLGVRPEDIKQNASYNSTAFEITLDLVEPMGSEVFIYFAVCGEQFTGRITGSEIPETGSFTTLYFENDKLYFFDPLTEKII